MLTKKCLSPSDRSVQLRVLCEYMRGVCQSDLNEESADSMRDQAVKYQLHHAARGRRSSQLHGGAVAGRLLCAPGRAGIRVKSTAVRKIIFTYRAVLGLAEYPGSIIHVAMCSATATLRAKSIA